MILTCPSCGTQYAVKDGAIPAQGRKVRCASCGTSWHQQPDEALAEAGQPEVLEPQAPEPAAAPDPADAPEPTEASEPTEAAEAAEPDSAAAEAIMPGYSTVPPIAPGPAHVEPPMAVPVPPSEAGEWPIRDRAEAEFDPDKEIPDRDEVWAVENETPAEGRRTWLMALLLGLLLVAALAAAFWLLAPDSLRRSIGMGSVASPLQVTVEGSRQTLASGNELLAVSGRVINPSGETQPVPPIYAQIRDGNGRILHSWTISRPVATLGAGQKASFNSAQMDVPAGGDQLTVSLGNPSG